MKLALIGGGGVRSPLFVASALRRAERVGLEDLLEGCPVVDVKPRRTKHSDYFEDEDLRVIRSHDLDVALRFGFRILRGGALEIARHGVWSYHHGDGLVPVHQPGARAVRGAGRAASRLSLLH